MRATSPCVARVARADVADARDGMLATIDKNRRARRARFNARNAHRSTSAFAEPATIVTLDDGLREASNATSSIDAVDDRRPRRDYGRGPRRRVRRARDAIVATSSRVAEHSGRS